MNNIFWFKDDEDEDDAGRVQEAEGLLSSLKESIDQNSGRLEDSLLIRLFRDKLKSKAVINKGCILDGFPKTYDQAKALYEEIDDDGEPTGTSDPTTVPEVVIDFTATEDFLKQRMMNLPEEVVQVIATSVELSCSCSECLTTVYSPFDHRARIIPKKAFYAVWPSLINPDRRRTRSSTGLTSKKLIQSLST